MTLTTDFTTLSVPQLARIDGTLKTHIHLLSLSAALSQQLSLKNMFSPGLAHRKEVSESFQHLNWEFFSAQNFCISKKKTKPNFEKLWNLNADEANPSVHGTRWATITLALKTSK